jgi:PAS domain-containing protein
MEPTVNYLEATQSRRSSWAAMARSSLVQESRLGPAVLHTLLAQLPVGVLVTDRRGRIIYENEFARRVLAAGSLSGNRITANGAPYTGLHADGSPYQKMEWPMARALLLGETVLGEEIDFISPDGTRRWLSVSASPVHAAPGRIDAAVGTCTDVTELKQAAALYPLIESLQRL